MGGVYQRPVPEAKNYGMGFGGVLPAHIFCYAKTEAGGGFLNIASLIKKNIMVKKKTATKSRIGIVPLRDRVLVRPLSDEELEGKTASGIIIPETVDKEKPEQGEVIAVGEGGYDDGVLVPPPVSVGDRVVFSRFGYDEVKHEDVEYFIIKSENILAIIN